MTVRQRAVIKGIYETDAINVGQARRRGQTNSYSNVEFR